MSFWQDIAIIGLQVSVPDANTPWALASNLLQKHIAIRPSFESHDFCFAKASIAHPGSFDAEFFQISPAEAHTLDPQHRLLLEVCYQALHMAGIDPGKQRLHAGVFACCSASIDHWRALQQNPSSANVLLEHYQQLLGNDKDFLATRIAYKLDFTGPALSVQSGCSSGLLALHQACRSLQLNECDLALACGASVTLDTIRIEKKIEGMIFSNTGACRPYAKEADGTVAGEGAVCIILKRLSEALASGDDIWAIIKGSAVNNDGRRKVSFSAPSVDAQISVMQQALCTAGISADEIGYIEGHGTGTLLGDAIELTALQEIYGQQNITDPIYLGSIKANLGHLDAASGLIGLIKGILTCRYQTIFPMPDTNTPHPLLQGGRLALATEITAFALHQYVAVNSLGIGGTNVHVILGAACQQHVSGILPKSHPQYWIPFSAPTETQLKTLLKHFQGMLRFLQHSDLERLMRSQHYLTEHHPYRTSVIASSLEGVINHLGAVQIDCISTLDEAFNPDLYDIDHCEQQWRTGYKLTVKKPKFWCTVPGYVFQLKPYPLPSVLKLSTSPVTSPLNAFSSPNETISSTIAQCWKQILGYHQTPKADDNFFASGGDSLMSVSLIQKINQALELKLSPVLIFDYPTLASLQRHVQELCNKSVIDPPCPHIVESYREL